MLRILSGLLTLPIGLAVSAAAVNAAPVRIAQSDCSRYGSNIEIKACLRRNYEAADGDLNRVYGRVKAGLGAEQRELLTDAQLGWITYRDKGCEFETFGSRGGTGYRGFLSQCMERVTRSRIAELEAFLRDEFRSVRDDR
jgi:uncharacterized protein YecT (DUF1311 family)